MAMEKQCNHQGIPGRLIPVPTEITAGCGLAWRMNVEDALLYRQQIQELGLRFDKTAELWL